MSKPVTTAPSRFAVAIACRPATPAPRTSTFAGRDGAGGGGHHREEAAGLARGEQGGGVAGDVRLRGERVHRLGAGDPRDRLHREAGHAGGGERLVGLGRGERREVADQHLALLQLADLLGGRDGDVDDDLGAPGIADLGPGLGVLGVGMAGVLAGAGLDHDVDAALGQRRDHGRNQRHAALGRRGFFRDPDLHPVERRGGHAPEPGQPNEPLPRSRLCTIGSAPLDLLAAARPGRRRRRSRVSRPCRTRTRSSPPRSERRLVGTAAAARGGPRRRCGRGPCRRRRRP